MNGHKRLLVFLKPCQQRPALTRSQRLGERRFQFAGGNRIAHQAREVGQNRGNGLDSACLPGGMIVELQNLLLGREDCAEGRGFFRRVPRDCFY